LLSKRIIPCLDVDKGRVVKGVKFLELKDAGDPVEVGASYDKKGADELVFLDITASSDDRDIVSKLVEKVSEKVFIPFTIGGGIRNLTDMRKILIAGADKISINSAAIKNPELISEGAKKFGSQCIVVAIDSKKEKGGNYAVYINGGRIRTDKNALEWAKEAEKLGAGEILLTSMDKDGTKSGYEIELTKMISESVNIPVIASGGAGDINDFIELFRKTEATAALAASIFHFKEIEISKLKEKLFAGGIPARRT
jgi:cyclase